MESEPLKITDLNGLSLGEAFRKVVIDDPDVIAIGLLALAESKTYANVFKEGQSPGPLENYTWDLDANAENLAYWFTSRPITFIDEQQPEEGGPTQ